MIVGSTEYLNVKYEYISTAPELRQFCDAIAAAPCIAYDTEFISEDRYRPELCLVQVAADDQLAIIDPLAIDHMEVFWNRVAADGHVTVVHAGREEFLFCYRSVGRGPSGWFDTQIASGLASSDYPASYATLVQRWLKRSLRKGETRTNWRHRPLNSRQLEYALLDVTYLEPLYRRIKDRLDALQRGAWLAAELATWQHDLQQEQAAKRWRRVSGQASMNRRQLAILRELWKWRDAESHARNIPSRRLLRDDLMVELARRESADPNQIRTIRGMDWRRLRGYIPAISECIAAAIALPDEQCPGRPCHRDRPAFNVLGQFLATAVNSIARAAHVAPTMVGTVQDVRDLIAAHLGYKTESPPRLARGWRHEIVGQFIDQLLDGRMSIRITDPRSEQPLSFEPVPDPHDAD